VVKEVIIMAALTRAGSARVAMFSAGVQLQSAKDVPWDIMTAAIQTIVQSALAGQ
jgi:hypothetical protein